MCILLVPDSCMDCTGLHILGSCMYLALNEAVLLSLETLLIE